MADVIKTLKVGGGGDYTSPLTWEATEQANLVSAGDMHYLVCDAGTYSYSSTIDFAGWITGPDNYIVIQAASGHEHHGVMGAGVVWSFTSNIGNAVIINTQKVHIKDIEFTGTHADFGNTILYINSDLVTANKNCLVEQCLVYFNAGSLGALCQLGGNQASAASHATLRGCLFYRSSSAGSMVQMPGDQSRIENCTIVNGTTGLYGNGGSALFGYVDNVVCYGQSTSCFSPSKAVWIASNNASSDATAPGTSPVTSLPSTAFVDYANGNYRPATTGALFEAGTDVGLTKDIRGSEVKHISIGAFDSDTKYVTLKSTGGDYSLMSTWESTEQADLTAVARAEKHVLECYKGTSVAGSWVADGSLEESRITIADWTTSASNTVTIKAAAGEEHGGVLGAGFYIKKNDHLYSIIDNFLSNIFFRDLQIRNEAFFGDGFNCSNTEGNAVSFDRVISHVGRNPYKSIRTGCIFRNCLGICTQSDSPVFAPIGATSPEFYNCTAITGKYGWWQNTNGTPAIKIVNCVAYGSTILDFDIQEINAPGYMSHCASGDTSASGTSPQTGITSADFVDYAGGDYRITDTSALYNAGTDLSGTFTDDIRGTATRYAASFDIGAYKFDVITKTLKSSLGDYSLMSTWESDEQTDLVADGERHILECYNDWPSGLDELVTVTDWVTDASSFITIKAAAGNAHGGTPGAGFFMRWTGTQNSNTLRIQQDYSVVTDIELRNDCSSNLGGALYITSDYVTLDRAISIKEHTGNSNSFWLAAIDHCTIRNCLTIAETGGSAWAVDQRQTGTVCYNNTAIGNFDWTVSSTSTGTVYINNVITGDVDTLVATHSGSTTNNAFGGTGAFGANQVTGVVTTDGVDFVEPSTGDYTPTSTGKLAGTGTDLSAFFDDDITGTPR